MSRTMRWVLILGVCTGTPLAYAQAEEDPFAFFLAEPLPRETIETLEYDGYVEPSFFYISTDNQQFGRYSAMEEEGWYFNLDLDYLRRDEEDLKRYFGFYGRDLGLKTRQFNLFQGATNDYRFQFDYQQLYQYNGLSYSPFMGVDGPALTLPAGWVSGATTNAMTALNPVDNLELKKQRDRISFSFRKRFDEMWSFETAFRNEEKTGLQTMGGAFYLDASNPHAALLPQTLDYTTRELDLAAHMTTEQGNLELRYLYSRFENSDNGLVWQNPYDANYGPAVDYPAGYGQMALAPDNQMHQWRASGNYRLSDKWFVQGGLSYSMALQDDDFLAYTMNDALLVPVALPRNSLDGEVNTTTLHTLIRYLASARLTLQAEYRYEDRDNQTPRDGYLYVRGDSGDQPSGEYTVYNRPTSHTKNTFGVEGQYRFPNRTRMTLGYEVEQIDRYNTAVESTQEDRFTLKLRNGSLQGLGVGFSIAFHDRAADTYHWDQSYYAFLDADLINQTPASQRYINHPLLSQYYLANRQRTETKLNLALGGSGRWQHNLDILWRDDDYDETELGLEWEQHTNMTFSSTYLPMEAVSITGYYTLDYLEAEQRGRAFRGGQEKNAFVVIPPYPQASDPDRDWTAAPTDTVHSLGMSANWQVQKDVLDLALDYRFTHGTGEENLYSSGVSGISSEDLPDNKIRQHHLTMKGEYQVNQDLRIGVNYQYFRYEETNWAVDDLLVNTINKVLWTGGAAANETVNAIGVTVHYNLP